jgi:transcription-repair coupling factor (superfamily II helicase)
MANSTYFQVGGAPEGFDAYLLAREVAKSDGPVIHIARDDKRLEALRVALRFFAPDMPVFDFPAWDCLPFDRMSPNSDLSAKRMATLAAFAHGAVPKRYVLLTTLAAATQRIPARSVLSEAAFTACVGERVNESNLRNFLVRMGFTQAPTVVEPGDYAIRGGIIDVFAPGQSAPVRMDFFGDELDSLRRFDPVSQRTTDSLKEITFTPVSEVILDEAAITRFRQNYRIEFGSAGTDDPVYEAISAGKKHAGIEHW